jgi:hypothetical protein
MTDNQEIAMFTVKTAVKPIQVNRGDQVKVWSSADPFDYDLGSVEDADENSISIINDDNQLITIDRPHRIKFGV